MLILQLSITGIFPRSQVTVTENDCPIRSLKARINRCYGGESLGILLPHAVAQRLKMINIGFSKINVRLKTIKDRLSDCIVPLVYIPMGVKCRILLTCMPMYMG